MTITEIHSNLLESVSADAPLVLSFSETDSVDLTFLQLLYAAKQSCAGRNIPIELAEPVPEALLRVAEEAGVQALIQDLTTKHTTGN